MRIRFWGCRGSIPTPGPDTVTFGGNTSCVEVRPDDETLFILDAGTGIRNLGKELMAGDFGTGRGEAHLFISHTHWDHIQGFPFFAPLLVPGNEITVYGLGSSEQNLKGLLSGQMQYSYFPLDFERLGASIDFVSLTAPFSMKGVDIDTKMLNHPGGSLAYRFSYKNTVVVYATDTEPFQDVLLSAAGLDDETGFSKKIVDHIAELEKEMVDFVRDADVLIYDAQYTREEYSRFVGFGHGYPEYSLGVALAARVKHLVLYHHDPNHSDEVVKDMMEKTQNAVAGKDICITAAAEGLEVNL